MAQPSLEMGLGLVMASLLAVLAIGAMVHFMGTTATAGTILASAPIAAIPVELKTALDGILAKMSEAKTIEDAERKKFGETLASTQETIVSLQRQLDAIDVKITEQRANEPQVKSLEEEFKENAGLQQLLTTKTGSAKIVIAGKHFLNWLERKTTIDRAALGFPTVAVLQSDRTPGIIQEARQILTVRNVLASRPTSLGMVDFVKINSAQAAASMQTESSAKVENAITFTTGSQKVETIASIIPASRQALEDMAELMAAIDSGLSYAVNEREEKELLFGNGNSPDLNGIYTQATAFNTALLSLTPGWTKSDQISVAIQQIAIAKEIPPTFVVLHPTDYWQILRTKDANRNYLFGNNGMVDPFWGLTPIPTVHMSSGEFLVGSGSPVAAEIRDRMALEVVVSTEHSDWFAKNLIAIRGEKRLALAVYRAGSFIKGTFNTSP
jgi:HK97 family phage major capsid protein